MIDIAAPQFRTARNTVGKTAPELAEINLEPYDTAASSPDAPASAPFALIDYGILRHTVKFRDSNTPDKRGKPAGVLGAEVWSKVGGDAPASDGDFSMIALKTSSPLIIDYPMTEAGKTVWYRLRWVTTSGEKGPWGETTEATINK